MRPPAYWTTGTHSRNPTTRTPVNGEVRIPGDDGVHIGPIHGEDEQSAGVVGEGPGHDERTGRVQFGKPLPMSGPGGKPLRTVVKREFEHDHAPHAMPTAVSESVSGDTATVLAHVPLLASLPQAHLAHLTAVSVTREVPLHEVVATRGEPANHLIVVEKGTLTAVHETSAGHRRRLGEFPAPCAVDKAAVLDDRGHTATWLAATQTRLRLIPAAEFRALVDVPSVRDHVFTHLATQLRQGQEDLVLTSYADATTRVAAWLVRAATARVVLPGAQQGLAETLGLTRVSVNRALRTLTEEGLVRVEPGAVLVTAPELLAHRAKRG